MKLQVINLEPVESTAPTVVSAETKPTLQVVEEKPLQQHKKHKVKNAFVSSSSTKSANGTKKVLETTKTLKNGLVIKILPHKIFNKDISLTEGFDTKPTSGHLLLNSIQDNDLAKCATIHLATIAYEFLNLEYKQVKTSTNKWGIHTELNIENITKHTKFEDIRALGFTFNTSTRQWNFYRQNANIKKLQEKDKEELQNMYNDVVEGAKISGSLNSKNNLFTSAFYQDSSFLLELNHLMDSLQLDACNSTAVEPFTTKEEELVDTVELTAAVEPVDSKMLQIAEEHPEISMTNIKSEAIKSTQSSTEDEEKGTVYCFYDDEEAMAEEAKSLEPVKEDLDEEI